MSRAERFAKVVPDPYILILAIIFMCTLATYVIPAGEYRRETVGGSETVVPGSYHQIEQQPVSAAEFLLSIQNGLIDSASIIFFILLVGGAFGIITATGAFDGMLANLVLRVRKTGNESLLLLIFPFMFGLLGGVVGMFEEFIPFVPLLVLLAITLGYDAVVGCSMVLIGAMSGFASGPLNPFTVGVAQGIAELPLFSAMWYRWIFWAISMLVGIGYIYYYASKVKKDPSRSLVSDIDYSNFQLEEDPSDIDLESAHYVVLAIVLAALITLIIGVLQYGWFINEIATLFLVTGFVAGVAYRMDPDDIIDNFIEGTKDVMYAALIVGFARGILVVLQEGAIFDTVVYALIQPLQQLPPIIAGALMVPVMAVVNFFIPSGSGQAAVVVPILAPIADVLNISRQSIILAFQYGDGFANLIVPTSGAMMAMISIAKIPYGRWAIYISKLVALQLLVGMVAVAIAIMINLGPT